MVRSFFTRHSRVGLTGYAVKDNPWLPVGVGICTGVAYVGVVGSSGGVTDITALGDAVNTTARLASSAAAGEILVSEAVCDAAGLGSAQFEERTLTLKGKQEPFRVRVLRAKEPFSILWDLKGSNSWRSGKSYAVGTTAKASALSPQVAAATARPSAMTFG